ncbi:bile acid:sodium symporter family protein [Bacillus sp. ISL-47]|uniref:bile acid:sodium symporter family protein n=1 Tax=Bacillus sp. ISL-47 TaxID=2819130 RepID=UPI001BE743FD|nr:bile acid:sodium symporter family protein [Bacillus sp. ISL-47]MBT2707039.1 bile acid:sodium symporter family protein [Pseudomonas sp. ISL-84]
MLYKLNKQLEKMMPLITPTSVFFGVLLAGYLKDYSYIIPWVFAFMTFSGSLNSNFSSLKQILHHPKPLFLIVFTLHILMPLFAWSTGHLAFGDDPYTITGLVLAMAIPTGISSFIWVSIYKGNIPLTLSIILIDTFLSPFIVPLTLSVFFQTTVNIDVLPMMTGLFWMVVLPSFLGMILNQVTKGKGALILSSRLAPFSKLGMAIVVMLNGAVVAPNLIEVNLKLILIAITVFFVAFMGYLLSFMIGNLLKYDRETTVAVTFNGGMRNISIGAVVAVTYFPPAVAVPVVLGMLFQQVLASLFGVIIKRHFSRELLQEGHSV